MNLRGRSFLTLKDFTPGKIGYLLDLSAKYKEEKKQGISTGTLKGKNMTLIFEETSIRTRCAFEVATHDLGVGTTYLDPAGPQVGEKENIPDMARVLGRIYEGIKHHGFGQDTVEKLTKYAGVPMWSDLTNGCRPTQMLADLLTVREQLGHLKWVKLVYMGDARYNMGNPLMIVCARMDMCFMACTPKKYFLDEELVKQCRRYAAQFGATITLTEDVAEGTRNTDIIYTDVWVSIGKSDEVWEGRIRGLTLYKVTTKVMSDAKDSAIFLHCLPAFHDLKTKIGKEMSGRFGIQDMEVTDEAFESAQLEMFDEAESRMHTIRAVMATTLGAQRYV